MSARSAHGDEGNTNISKVEMTRKTSNFIMNTRVCIRVLPPKNHGDKQHRQSGMEVLTSENDDWDCRMFPVY